jgi:hypothetical protein
MAEIIRSWLCLNARCHRQFDSWEANPSCPACKCVRVQWVPGGGHVSGTASAADAELRKLADNFGLTNINSAERGRAAKQVATSAPSDPRSGPAMNFGNGFAAVVDPGRGAQCVPTANRMDFKAKVGIGHTLPPSKDFPSIRTGTAIEAAHKP